MKWTDVRVCVCFALLVALSTCALAVVDKSCRGSNLQAAVNDRGKESHPYEIEPCYEAENKGLYASLKFVRRTNKSIVLRYALHMRPDSDWVLSSDEIVLVYFYDSQGNEIKHIGEECLLGDDFAHFRKQDTSDEIEVALPKGACFVSVGMGGARLITKPPMPIPGD